MVYGSFKRDIRPDSLKSGDGNGTSGGMDAWQQSVEKRLDSLDGRAQRLEVDVGAIKVDVAVLNERVSHLPTKGWMVGALTTGLIVITGLIAFMDKIRALLA